MTIDADALTAIARRRPGEQLAISGRLPASVAYAVAPRREVLVIGPGGGVDVGAALAFGATRVDAVEVNAGVARLVLGPLAAYGGDLFREPGVRLVLDEGRGYLHRSPRRYDAIVLTAVDSWAALASGAYSLAESYLYTSEAMDVYLDHLHEGGVLAVSRWLTAPPREMQRLAVMAGDACGAGEFPDEGRILLRAGGGGGVEPAGRRGTSGPCWCAGGRSPRLRCSGPGSSPPPTATSSPPAPRRRLSWPRPAGRRSAARPTTPPGHRRPPLLLRLPALVERRGGATSRRRASRWATPCSWWPSCRDSAWGWPGWCSPGADSPPGATRGAAGVWRSTPGRPGWASCWPRWRSCNA